MPTRPVPGFLPLKGRQFLEQIDWKGAGALESRQKILRIAAGPFYFAGDWTSNSTGRRIRVDECAIQAMPTRATV